MATQEKLLPQNVEAEASVLGSILINPDALIEVRGILRAEDFYRHANRVIFQAMLDLDTTGQAPDLITLCDELARRGKLDEIGGASYVGSLANHVPSSLFGAQYARIVERTAVARRIINAAGQIAAVAYNEPDADAMTTEVLQLLRDATVRTGDGERVWLDVAADAFLAESLAAMREAPEAVGVRTGIAALDEHLSGIKPGELVYLAGRPGHFKSTLAVHMALAVAESCATRGEGMCEYVSLEMRATQQVKRIISAAAEVDGRLIRAGFHSRDEYGERQREEAAWEVTKRSAEEHKRRLARRLAFLDKPVTMPRLRAYLTHSVAKYGCVCAMIDYLGLVEAEQGNASEYQRISAISRELKQIALELQVPIICLVQLNRDPERRNNKRPTLGDLRDSGQLEQDADIVLSTYFGANYFPRTAQGDAQFGQFLEVTVLKARDGVAATTIPVRVEPRYTRVSDWPAGWPWQNYAAMIGSDEAKENGQ